MSFVNTNDQQLLTPDTPSLGSEFTDSGHFKSWTSADTSNPVATTSFSRKRSRDESSFDAEDDSSYFSHPVSQTILTPAPIPEEPEPEPIYGEGMVLMNPATGRALSAESQTGTWYEERAAREADEVMRQQLAAEVAAEEAARQFRPKLPVSRKSIRLSQSSIRADIESSVNNNMDGLGTHSPASPPRSSGDRPEVDEATIALGIGWTKMATEDPDLQAAARGWARYIENHYRNIHGAEILLKSRSLNAYLIGSQEGFFLFSEDLLEGKLVGRNWESALENLKSGQFEGVETLKAERTPGPEDGKDSMLSFQQPHPQTVVVDGSGTAGGMDLD